MLKINQGNPKKPRKGRTGLRSERSRITAILAAIPTLVLREKQRGGETQGRGKHTIKQEQKISPKRKFWAGCPQGYPAKNFGQALEILEKQAFWHGHPGRTSMKKLRSEKLRADFSFPNKPPPKKKTVLDPPTYDTIPPPLFTQCHSPHRERAQTRQIPLSEASKTGFGGGTL